MGKLNKKHTPSRANYSSESRRHKNRVRKQAKHAAAVDFHRLRNDIIDRTGLKKTDAKRVTKLVLNGLDEEEAFEQLGLTYRQIQTEPT